MLPNYRNDGGTRAKTEDIDPPVADANSVEPEHNVQEQKQQAKRKAEVAALADPVVPLRCYVNGIPMRPHASASDEDAGGIGGGVDHETPSGAGFDAEDSRWYLPIHLSLMPRVSKGETT